jgi:hypothetical protein
MISGIFKAWNKLEPNSRNDNLSQTLRATIHDPAWMLARQWQLAEFQGEDTGSPVKIELTAREGAISRVILGDGHSFDYTKDIPLEVLIEKMSLELMLPNQEEQQPPPQLREPPTLDVQTRVKLGLQFQYEMDVLIKDIVRPQSELRKFKRYLAKQPEFIFQQLTDEQLKFEMNRASDYLYAIIGRVIDITKTIDINSNDISVLKDRVSSYGPFAGDAIKISRVNNQLEIAFNNLKNWWRRNCSDNNTANIQQEPFLEMPCDVINNNGSTSKETAWDPKHLEYNFKVEISSRDNNNKLVLNAPEYKEDHLDWYSFVIDRLESSQSFVLPEEKKLANNEGGGSSDDPSDANNENSTTTIIIPTPLPFPSMPERRWWNFEDSYIDFGSISPPVSNIVSLLLLEFAFVYSADWFVIPYTKEVGKISQIHSLTIIDSFGDTTSIEPAGYTQKEIETMTNLDRSWDSWSMFSLSKKYENKDQQNNTPYFFIPPVTADVTYGPAIEEVKFLRDETANMVWAIEKTYRTLLGEPISGSEHYLSRRKRIEANSQSSESNNSSSNNNSIKYTLMTSVPWNWIPFIPVNANESLLSSSPSSSSAAVTGPDSSWPQMELQRAAIVDPEILDPTTGKPRIIKPNSRILSEVASPYYIDESEVPREGVLISERYQQVVGSNGRIFLWISRKKSIGSGEGSSGLKFDSIPLNKKV